MISSARTPSPKSVPFFVEEFHRAWKPDLQLRFTVYEGAIRRQDSHYALALFLPLKYYSTIKPLTKGNYDTWAMQIEAVIVKNSTWAYVNGKKPKPELVENNATSIQSVKKWEEEDAKAKQTPNINEDQEEYDDDENELQEEEPNDDEIFVDTAENISKTIAEANLGDIILKEAITGDVVTDWMGAITEEIRGLIKTIRGK
ncbi:hypothetical protein EVAR_24687_1 [Eumeta japonica]|uniref:DUF4219 domain-containing protein n=1 Tax=Eumeta variegata TaxID=151549 RepID=A0A4C1WFV1_EUMVA|nr:hypothetical protein EVAR_24687_1 [Eumeta japonica]